MTRLPDWLRRDRFSWLDLVRVLLIWLAFQVTQDLTMWPWWLAVVVVTSAIFAAICVVAFIHGVRESLHG